VCVCTAAVSAAALKYCQDPKNRVSANQNAKRKTNKETQMLAGESEHKSKVAMYLQCCSVAFNCALCCFRTLQFKFQ